MKLQQWQIDKTTGKERDDYMYVTFLKQEFELFGKVPITPVYEGYVHHTAKTRHSRNSLGDNRILKTHGLRSNHNRTY